jgi:putative hydrolase of the HAD superfamily
MTIDYILVDLDNTVYPSSSGLMDEIGRRMTRFISERLGISEEQALQLRRNYSRSYGTSLAGLMAHNQIETPEDFLEYVHPKDVTPFLKRDPILVKALSSLPVPIAVLTNSPMEHARRVLECLGVNGLFAAVFDLRYSGFQGKPLKKAYLKVLGELGREAPDVLLVDDHLSNLVPFRRLGGEVLLVDERGETTSGVPVIRYLRDLPFFLETGEFQR